MLATLNGYTSGGVAQSASFGLFDNDVDMALNLGFTGFRRGYDFYKSDWKYLNDPTMRGGLNTTAATATGTITGLMVPAGSTSVYDQIMGKNAKRPFLHVRYRASEAEDRRYKTWITGSAEGSARRGGRLHALRLCSIPASGPTLQPGNDVGPAAGCFRHRRRVSWFKSDSWRRSVWALES